MKTPHKHARLIKEWADGAEIQMSCGLAKWASVEFPTWCENCTYRIKPEPKPDKVQRYRTHAHVRSCHVVVAEHWDIADLKLTFDGETGKLKSAEVL